MQNKCINYSIRCLCLYDYFSLVENLLDTQAIDINRTTIQHQNIQWNSTLKHLVGFNLESFNGIQHQVIRLYSTSNHSMKFNIKSFNGIKYQII